MPPPAASNIIPTTTRLAPPLSPESNSQSTTRWCGSRQGSRRFFLLVEEEMAVPRMTTAALPRRSALLGMRPWSGSLARRTLTSPRPFTALTQLGPSPASQEAGLSRLTSSARWRWFCHSTMRMSSRSCHCQLSPQTIFPKMRPLQPSLPILPPIPRHRRSTRMRPNSVEVRSTATWTQLLHPTPLRYRHRPLRQVSRISSSFRQLPTSLFHHTSSEFWRSSKRRQDNRVRRTVSNISTPPWVPWSPGVARSQA